MFIIGERINSTRKLIREAVLKRDADYIKMEATKQMQAGAHMLDINGGVAGQEVELLSWLASVVQEACDVPLCLDSSDPEALHKALPLCKQTPIINSITEEPDRFNSLLPLIREHKAKVIALCMAASGPPANAQDRIDTATRLVEKLAAGGIALDDIYIDPAVFPVGTGSEHGPSLLNAVSEIRNRFPEAHTSCGVSNVSFGLPVRKLLNEIFLIMLMSRGMDAAIIDPCDFGLIARITAAEALRGGDEFCVNYIRAYKQGKLEFLKADVSAATHAAIQTPQK
jgi:cobalamin-dependent methionine synthase I